MKKDAGKQSLTKNIFKVIAISAAIIALLLGIVYMIMSIDDVKEDKSGKTSEQNDGDKNASNRAPAGDKAEVIDGIYYPAESDIKVDKDTGEAYVDNTIIVFFKNDTTEDEINKTAKTLKGEIVSHNEVVDAYKIKVKERSLKKLNDLCKKASDIDCVKTAFVDYATVETTNAIPNDPWKKEGFLKKLIFGSDRESWDEDDPNGNNWWAEAVEAPSAWNHKDELEKIKIGVIDMDLDKEHEDLKEVVSCWMPTYPEEKDGHGTHVSGIIGAKADNGKGISGILWDCDIVAGGPMGYKKENGNYYVTSITADMFTKLVKDNAKVINYSIGRDNKENWEISEYLDSEARLLSRYMLEALERGHDFVVVQSAGNGDRRVDKNGEVIYDEDGNPKRIAVEATRAGDFAAISKKNCEESDKTRAEDIIGRIIVVGNAEKYAPKKFRQEITSNFGSRVDICAPGTNIYSTLPKRKGISKDGYGYMTGTSMAAPAVSGVAGMVWAADPSLTGPEVKEIVCDERNTKYNVKASKNQTESKKKWDYRMVSAKRAVEDALKKAGKLEKDDKTENNEARKAKVTLPPENDTSPDYEKNYNYIDTDWSRKVVLVLDASGSMDGEPMYKTKDAARRFVDQMDSIDAEVSIVEYSNYATVLSGFTKDKNVLYDAIDQLEPYDQTNIEDGLYQADQLLAQETADKKIIVLMSDGQPNEGLVDEDLIYYANTIKDEGDIIYTLGFFDYVEDLWYSQYLMEQIATPGFHYEADDPNNLRYFFEDLGEQIKGARYMYIRIACPVDVIVTNGAETLSSTGENYNTRAEFGNLGFESNEYGDDTKVLRLREGEPYDIKIKGYDSGWMNYTINYMGDDGEYNDVRSFDIEVNNKTVIDTVADVSSKTRLKVDNNGDGHYDATYVAGRNGYGELRKNNSLPFIIILLVVALAVVVVYKNKHKIMRTTGRRRSVRK